MMGRGSNYTVHFWVCIKTPIIKVKKINKYFMHVYLPLEVKGQGFLLFSFVLILKGKMFLHVCVKIVLYLHNLFGINSSKAFLEYGRIGV